MQVEICTICNNKIGLREQVCVFNYEIVCERCDRELRKVPSLRVSNESLSGFGEDGPNPLQVAFAEYLDLRVPSNVTQCESAHMIDEELAYRKLVSVENGSSRVIYQEVKSLKTALFLVVGILFRFLSLRHV
jgi:hypothetical protein